MTNRIVVRVARELYYNKESMWGIVSVEPTKSNSGFSPEVNQWGNFVMRGNLPFSVMKGQEIDVELSDKQYDPKYKSDYYEIVRVHLEALNTVESQQRFLYAIVSEYRANLIVKAYPENMVIDDIKDNKIDLTTIKGIGENTAKEVKDAIDRNKELGALMVELADLNLTGRMLNKVIEKFGNTDKALYKVKESLYNLCSISGISFKRVDDAAIRRGEDRFSTKRINAYSEHYFDEIANQGHSWVSERVYLEQAVVDLEINGKYIREFLDSEEGKESFKWEKSDKKISSMRMYNNEKETLKNLLRIANKYDPPVNFDVDKAIKDAEDILNVKYADEQKEAIKESVKHGVFILNGKAGTGKTTAVKGIIEVLSSIGVSYVTCALSGKAANVLISKGIESATIHRAFGLGLSNSSEKPTKINSVDGEDSEEMGEDVRSTDVIIVDETSMVNAQIFSTILKKIKNGAKLILVGDSGQLSAIGHGDVLRDLLRTKYFKTFELTSIHRQAKESGIIEAASLIRDGEQLCKQNFDGRNIIGSNKDMVLIGYQDKDAIPLGLEKVLVGQAKLIKQPTDIFDYQVVVAMKERGELSARSINNLAQSIFNDMSKDYITGNGYEFREGDKVIVKGNTYDIKYYDDIEHYNRYQEDGMKEEHLKAYLEEMRTYATPEEVFEFQENLPQPNKGDLFNGTMGIVQKVFELIDFDIKKNEPKKVKWMLVWFENLGVIAYEQTNLDNVELAYAATCHRLQGSTIKNVIVVLDYSAYSLLSRQWVYTAITRASKKCVLMVQSSALVKAIATDSSGNRQTFLGDMINTVRSSRGELTVNDQLDN